MGQGTQPSGDAGHGSHRRGILISFSFLLAIAVVVIAAQVLRPVLQEPSASVPPPSTAVPSTLPTFRPGAPLDRIRSVSLDFDIVDNLHTDWQGVDARLDQVGATTVNLNAGRVEFTAFDWPAHPDAAAVPGVDHLAVAANALHLNADGSDREINLILDTYVPEWIKEDPSLAGVDARGRRSTYTASAAQILEGEVGQRLRDYAVALADRYHPNQIEVTELFLNVFSFGADDLALYQRMTGAKDWPRSKGGEINTDAPALGTWRSEVLRDFMAKMRTAVDAVEGGSQIELALDVRVSWRDPAGGRPESGHDYAILLESGIRLQLWTYFGRAGQPPEQIRSVTAALKDAGFDMTRFIISVGLWKGDTQVENLDSISAAELGVAVGEAATNGIIDVNVTPYSLMTDAHWASLETAWG
ncbi:MAG: hypothetical protein QM779_13725 [Propionicimonas sp.]|uniref:hypothetical protein n=1 Tax=Propionicimonas sp. TaxID=1955623 RepID=UPI003D10C252